MWPLHVHTQMLRDKYVRSCVAPRTSAPAFNRHARARQPALSLPSARLPVWRHREARHNTCRGVPRSPCLHHICHKGHLASSWTGVARGWSEATRTALSQALLLPEASRREWLSYHSLTPSCARILLKYVHLLRELVPQSTH